jgi:hypothetical protein
VWTYDAKGPTVTRSILVLALLSSAVCCNSEGGEKVGHAGSPDNRDAGTEATEAGATSSEPATAEVVQSKVAEALGNDEFRQAACAVAGVVAHSQDASVSCQAVVDGCLDSTGGLDASALPAAVGVPDQTLALQDCNVTAEQTDACLADIVGVMVDLSASLDCSQDAGAVTADLGPQLLLGAPSCLQVALVCPALLQLITTAMPM